jgi:peptidoglycan/xylan/chitin deacetylase (PgdA/CDA1 family)
MYHDVVTAGRPDESGFPGPGPAVYKLDWTAFEAHLDALAGAAAAPAAHGEEGWLLTFDDGGACSRRVAETLAERGWVGHFLVTTALLGADGFATEDDLRAMHALGQVVGSHSHTHPERISGLDAEEIAGEWTTSIERLGEILGEPVIAASVPGGFSSQAVEHAAAAAGVRVLFTSLPTTKTRVVDGCLVLGRYAVRATTAPDEAAALLTGRGLARRRQSAAWAVRGVPKRVLGGAYPRIRGAVLGRRRA